MRRATSKVYHDCRYTKHRLTICLHARESSNKLLHICLHDFKRKHGFKRIQSFKVRYLSKWLSAFSLGPASHGLFRPLTPRFPM